MDTPENPQPQSQEPPPVPPPGAFAEPGPVPPHADIASLVGDAWKMAWGALKTDTVALLIGGIAAAILSGVTLGIIAGAMAWGFFAMCEQRFREHKPMRVETVFQHFERFGTSLLTVVLAVVAVAVGLVLLVVPGLYLAVAFLYALPIAFDEKVDSVEALRRSRRYVHATGFWSHAAVAASICVVGGVLSTISRGALNILWYPFAMAVVIAGYELAIRPYAVRERLARP